jgi:hypothetical protein
MIGAASVGKSRAAVLRRSERRRLSSANDDEVGGSHARLREQLQEIVSAVRHDGHHHDHALL